MSSYFWCGKSGGKASGGYGFSTTSTPRQQRWLVRTVAGSLVAGACGYYGAHSRFLFFSNFVLSKDVCGTLSKQREVFLFWSIDDIHIISVRPSRRRLTKPPSLSLWNDNNNNNNKKSRARSKTRRITGSFKKRRRGTRARFTR